MSYLEQHRKPAILALADGTVFTGVSIGAEKEAVAEVVFNTSMTGYQEIITDPSYANQIITLTYPHIGNVGVNPDDMESDSVWASGLIISKLSPIYSSWRAKISLEEFLQKQNIAAIGEIDTRRLTHILREKGAQAGCIMVGDVDPGLAIENARSCMTLEGQDLASKVTTKDIYSWKNDGGTISDRHVVVYDFGVKQQILRLLVDRGCSLTVIPATTPAEDVLAMNPVGVLLSNGPGDPAACSYAIKNIQKLLNNAVPMFGICLGFQLLALACGAKTFKMKFGHHGANHPVQDIRSKGVYITSQNHGFAVDENSLPSELEITHRSLFDNTLQGTKHKTKPALGLQGHPEASPGPHDISSLFDEFIGMINAKT